MSYQRKTNYMEKYLSAESREIITKIKNKWDTTSTEYRKSTK